MRPVCNPLGPLMLMAAAASGADAISPPLVAGELLVGTSGVEPGVAVEWIMPSVPALRLRPELFLQDGDRPGIGGAVLWQVPVALPAGHDVCVGPRLVFHNGQNHDDPHGECDAMGIYRFPIIPTQPGHHHIEIITALGFLDKNGIGIGASVGGAYVYTF